MMMKYGWVGNKRGGPKRIKKKKKKKKEEKERAGEKEKEEEEGGKGKVGCMEMARSVLGV